MLYFSTRTKARNFASKTGRKVVDLQSGSLIDLFKASARITKRWAVKVV